jgi:hypothetical protein
MFLDDNMQVLNIHLMFFFKNKYWTFTLSILQHDANYVIAMMQIFIFLPNTPHTNVIHFERG